MTTEQRRQIARLQGNGWEVALEKEDRIELIHLALPRGAFSVSYVHPEGSFSWQGSFPLARLDAMYPSFDVFAGE